MERDETLAECVARLQLTIAAEFVPFSESRNAKESSRSLNWRVTLQRDGKDIVTTDYSAGIAHCPSYKRLKIGATFGRGMTLEQEEAINFETERGRAFGRVVGGAPIKPDPLDVIASLAMDSDVLDFTTFESWASEFGYDTDSRKAESIYRACLTIALQMRAAIGDSALAELRDAAGSY